MKALIFAAAAAMLLSPTFCQSGKPFSYGISGGGVTLLGAGELGRETTRRRGKPKVK